jgi:hypothetical protein
MFYQNKYCYICCRNTDHHDGDCCICREQKEELEHREHFSKLNAMTMEERVRRIEHILYEQKKNPPWVEPRY